LPGKKRSHEKKAGPKLSFASTTRTKIARNGKVMAKHKRGERTLVPIETQGGNGGELCNQQIKVAYLKTIHYREGKKERGGPS